MKKPAFFLICALPVIAVGWVERSDTHHQNHKGLAIPPVMPAQAGTQPPVIPAQPSVIPAQAGTQRTLPQRTAEALGLTECRVINLTLPQTVEMALTENKELPAFTITLPIRGQTCTLELWPHSVRSPHHFEVKAQQADGSWVMHDPGPVRTVRGIVVDTDSLPLL